MNKPQIKQFIRQKVRPTTTNADMRDALDAVVDFAAVQPGGNPIVPTTPQEIALLGTETLSLAEVVTKFSAALAALSAAPSPAPVPDSTPTPTPGTPTAAGAYPAAYLANY